MAFAGLLVDEISFVQASKEVTSVMGVPLISLTVNKSVWELDTPDNASSPASLILAIFTNEAEIMFLTGRPFWDIRSWF